MKIEKKVVMEVRNYLALEFLVAISIGGILLLVVTSVYFYTQGYPLIDNITIIGLILFSIIGFLAWKKNSKKDWGDCVLEVYDDGWIRMRVIDWYPDIPLDSILKGWFRKKYIKKIDKWKVQFQIYFIYNKSYVSNVCGGILKEPEKIEEVEEIADFLKNIAERNKKEGKKPKGFYDDFIYWQNSEEGKRIKEERDKLRREAGIPVE